MTDGYKGYKLLRIISQLFLMEKSFTNRNFTTELSRSQNEKEESDKKNKYSSYKQN